MKTCICIQCLWWSPLPEILHSLTYKVPLSILFGSSLLTNRSNLFRRLDLDSPLLTLVFSRLFGRTLYVKVRYSSYCHLSNSLFCDSCVSNLRCVFLLLKNFLPIQFVKIMLVIPSP